MKKPQTPSDDHERVSALADYAINYRLPDQHYNDLIRIAAQLSNTPVAFISLVTDERQCFVSQLGFQLDETPREYSFCAHLVASTEEFMMVPDAREDDRFHDNPYVTGYPYIVFYAGFPLKNPEGYRVGTLCVVDKKPGKLSSEQVQSLEALANQVVNQMELDKQKKALNQANQALEQNNAELEKFAHRAAHDIKGPLKNLSMLSDYLMQTQQENLDEQGSEMLQMLGQACRELENLVQGILLYSKNDKALQEGSEAIQLPAFFEELKRLLDMSEVSRFDYPENSHVIYTNKTALKQILLNLLTNAIKYCDKSAINIKLDFEEDDNQYHFWVTDNGPGISEAYQEQIFQMFEVLSNKDRHGGSGTGIGLATVEKLLKGLGGDVQVSSTVEEGATFKVSLQKPL